MSRQGRRRLSRSPSGHGAEEWPVLDPPSLDEYAYGGSSPHGGAAAALSDPYEAAGGEGGAGGLGGSRAASSGGGSGANSPTLSPMLGGGGGGGGGGSAGGSRSHSRRSSGAGLGGASPAGPHSPSAYPSLLDPPRRKRRKARGSPSAPLAGRGGGAGGGATARGGRRCACAALLLAVAGAAALVAALVLLPDRVREETSAAFTKEANLELADLYVPTNGSDAFERWLTNAAPDKPAEYVLYRLYAVSNADDVLERAAEPRFNLTGPFIYRRHTRKLGVAGIGEGHVAYSEEVSLEPVLEATLTGVDGKTSVVRGLDASATRLRMLRTSLLGVAAQMETNPFDEPRLRGILQDCSENLNATTTMQCLDSTLRWTSGGNTSLADVIMGGGGGGGGLMPERSAADWIGAGPSTAGAGDLYEPLLGALYRYVLAAGPAPDVSRWAYFVNTTQYSANATLANVRPQERHFDRENLGSAMSYSGWDGLSTIRSVDSTGGGDANVLSYARPFRGWGVDFSMDSGLVDGLFTRPDLPESDTITVWYPPAARPIAFEPALGGPGPTYFGLTTARWEMSEDFFANSNFNERVYFSTINGLANVSSLHGYVPFMLSQPGHRPPPADGSPVPEAGVSFMDVDTRSGLVVNSAVSMQLNTFVPSFDFRGSGLPYNMGGNNVSSSAVRPEAFYPVAITETRVQPVKAFATSLLPLRQHAKTKVHLHRPGRSYALAGGVAALVLAAVAAVFAVRRCCCGGGAGGGSGGDEEAGGAYGSLASGAGGPGGARHGGSRRRPRKGSQTIVSDDLLYDTTRGGFDM